MSQLWKIYFFCFRQRHSLCSTFRCHRARSLCRLGTRRLSILILPERQRSSESCCLSPAERLLGDFFKRYTRRSPGGPQNTPLLSASGDGRQFCRSARGRP
jgi:hypothetical protein